MNAYLHVRLFSKRELIINKLLFQVGILYCNLLCETDKTSFEKKSNVTIGRGQTVDGSEKKKILVNKTSRGTIK